MNVEKIQEILDFFEYFPELDISTEQDIARLEAIRDCFELNLIQEQESETFILGELGLMIRERYHGNFMEFLDELVLEQLTSAGLREA